MDVNDLLLPNTWRFRKNRTYRNYNKKNNITGALVCRDDIYLQLLEGPKYEVNLTFEKISNDDRHLEIELLLKEYCNKRIFPGWNMKDDPARTWFWNKEEINSGIFNKIPRAKIIEVFEKIANQIN